jgi:glycosyltransferase involved in cell wall biosynthesis
VTRSAATLKLLLYSHDWAPSVGGVEIVTMALARGFAAWADSHPGQNIETTVVTNTPAGAMDDARLPFRVIRRPGKRRLTSLIRSADVIHVASAALPPLALAWAFRKPVVIEHSGYQSICPNGLLVYEPDRSVCPGHFMARRYANCVRCNTATLGRAASLRSLLLTFPRRWLARRVNRNIAPSRHIASRNLLPHTETIYHGVPDRPVAVSRPNAAPPSFAYVGRLVPEKGVAVLLRAARGLAQRGYSFQLKIAGDGPERRHLESMASEWGLLERTTFLGTVPGDAIPALLSAVTAVVMPSIWEDVAPLAASEQLMQGNVLIASDIGGLGELVGDAGLKFPAGDDNALQSCMRRVIDEPSLVDELRVRARRRGLEVFQESRMVADHVRLYQSLHAAAKS